MRHQPPSAPSTGQQFSPPPGWIARHKVLTGVGAFVAICLIGSAASASSGHAKPTAANKVTTSSSHTESVTSAATTSESAQQAVDATIAAAKAAAEKAAAATASKAAAEKAVAAKAAAVKAAADKAAADKVAAARAAAAAAAAAATPPTTSAPNCTPGYDPCIPPGPDVDCAGGTGNGPRYVQGPITVTGSDPYRLDADHNGIGCEN
jgi:cytoskeletal protein RodZ